MNSELVVLAKIDEITVRKYEQDSHQPPEIVASVTVVEAFKGSTRGEVVELYTEATSCAAPFLVGDTFIIFATRREKNGRFVVNMCNISIYHSVLPEMAKHNARFKENAAISLQILRGQR